MLAILKAHSLEFYIFAAVVVTLTGICKSGFSLDSVPLRSLSSPFMCNPLKAAATMLPILSVMDCLGLWAKRKLCLLAPAFFSFLSST